jgi:hypothetical protein
MKFFSILTFEGQPVNAFDEGDAVIVRVMKNGVYTNKKATILAMRVRAGRSWRCGCIWYG